MPELDAGMSAIADVTPPPDTSTDDISLDTPEDGAEPLEAGIDAPPDTQGDKEGVGTKVDGRTLPANVRSALKAFREASPEHAQAAKILNDAYGHAEAYKQVFAKVEDARQARALIETVGGQEGLATLQSTLASVEQTDALLESGDPALLDQIFQDAPEGAAKLLGPYLDKVSQSNREAYDAALRPHFVAALEGAGFGNAVYALADAMQKGDTETAKRISDSLTGWFNDNRQKAESSKKSSLDPERVKLNEERQKLNEEKEGRFKEQIHASTNQYAAEALGKSLAPYLKQLNLGPEAKTDLAEGIYGELGRLMSSDQAYQKQIKAFMASKNRDPERIAAFVRAKIDAIQQQAVKTVVQRRYSKTLAAPGQRKPAVAQNPAPAAASSPSAPKFVAQRPPSEQLDHRKTSADDLIRGRAYLRNGQFVTWRKV